MRPRVLVTGAGGFAGQHLCRYLALLPEPPLVFATDVAACPDLVVERFTAADITDFAALSPIVGAVAPTHVIHLAGVFGSSTDPLLPHRVNLLEAIRSRAPAAVVVTIGSAAEYGFVDPADLPVTEGAPCRPLGAYGLTKHLATQMAHSYHRMHGLTVTIARPFQLIGPGMPPTLAPGAFLSRVRAARAAGSATFATGSLDGWRDFVDVRDAAAALWQLCVKPAGSEVFNVCSGIPTQMAELVELILAATGAAALAPRVDPALAGRGPEVGRIYGSYAKLRRHCGWVPHISLAESVKAMVEAE